MAGVKGVFDNPEGFLPEPLGVKVLHGWQLRPGDVLCILKFSFNWNSGVFPEPSKERPQSFQKMLTYIIYGIEKI